MRLIKGGARRRRSQGFSDKAFEPSDFRSGILDTNSAPRRKVNKIDRPPPIVLIDRNDCPLTTKFAADKAARGNRKVNNGSARSKARDPFSLVERRIRTRLTPTQLRLRFLLEKHLTKTETCYMLRASAAHKSGGKGLMYEPTTVGRQPHSPHREIPRLEART
jgi:hypothetical protein